MRSNTPARVNPLTFPNVSNLLGVLLMIKRFIYSLASCGLAFAALTFQPSSATAGMITSFSGSTGGSALAGQLYANFDNRPLGNTTPTTATACRWPSPAAAPSSGQLAVPDECPDPLGATTTCFRADHPRRTGHHDLRLDRTGVDHADLRGAEHLLRHPLGVDRHVQLADVQLRRRHDPDPDRLGGRFRHRGCRRRLHDGLRQLLRTAFRSVVATSTQNSFEFDNVAFAVPEPSSLVLCGIAGLAGLGSPGPRRRPVA